MARRRWSSYALVSPHRVRALCWLALALLPALAILPALTRPLRRGRRRDAPGVVDEMNRRRRRSPLTSVARRCAARGGRRPLRAPAPGPAQPRRGSATGSWPRSRSPCGLLASVVGFVAAVGDPVHWIGDRVGRVPGRRARPTSPAESSRFTFNAGSDRYDTWRVALDDFSDDPLLGDGGGGYQLHLPAQAGRRRPRTSTTRTASSSRLLSELGLGRPCPVRDRDRRGDRSAIVRAATPRPRRGDPRRRSRFASGGYWLMHASRRLVLALSGAHRPGARAGRLRLRTGDPHLAGAHSTRRWRVWLIARARRTRAERDPALALGALTSTTRTRAGAPTSAAPTRTSTAPAA